MMKEKPTSEFNLTTHAITFRPKEVASRLVDAAQWCGLGVHAFIETAIKDRLYEVESAMTEGENDGEAEDRN